MANKFFVGGLAPNTTEDHMQQYFSAFGTVTDCVCMRDAAGRSRNFGFVTFDGPGHSCTAGTDHVVNGKNVDVKSAIPEDQITDRPGRATETRKVWVGGLAETTSEEAVRTYFETYFGALMECSLKVEPHTNKSRGFAFITFKTQEEANRACAQQHDIEGATVDCKPARPQAPMANRAPPGMAGRGGYGGGYGRGYGGGGGGYGAAGGYGGGRGYGGGQYGGGQYGAQGNYGGGPVRTTYGRGGYGGAAPAAAAPVQYGRGGGYGAGRGFAAAPTVPARGGYGGRGAYPAATYGRGGFQQQY